MLGALYVDKFQCTYIVMVIRRLLQEERGYRLGWCWHMLRERWGVDAIQQHQIVLDSPVQDPAARAASSGSQSVAVTQQHKQQDNFEDAAVQAASALLWSTQQNHAMVYS